MKDLVSVNAGLHVDDRGALSFINDIEGFKVQRLYVIENHKNEFIRAWHGHEKEEKIFFPISGSFLLGAVKVEDFLNPTAAEVPRRFILSSQSPGAVYVPGGYANGLMNLTPDAKILVLSNSTLEESKKDDFRFSFDYWDIWEIEKR
jgi:dTDP-4-dehydrorhamnose 3,5-epimerase